MRDEDSLPARRVQERGEGGRRGGPSAETAGADHAAASRPVSPALQPLRDALTAALRQRVAQRTVRDQPAQPPLVGHLCEQCQDAPAVLVRPAPWGGEMGVCAACQQEPSAGDAAPQAET